MCAQHLHFFHVAHAAHFLTSLSSSAASSQTATTSSSPSFESSRTVLHSHRTHTHRERERSLCHARTCIPLIYYTIRCFMPIYIIYCALVHIYGISDTSYILVLYYMYTAKPAEREKKILIQTRRSN